MKAVQFALATVLASGAVLSAQEGTPRYEVGLNYSWLHVNSANQDRQRTGNGGSGSFAYNINKVVGLVGGFVPADSFDAGEAEGVAAGVAGAFLDLVEGDFQN